MRFNSYKEGDERLVRRFLWLPLTFSGETRWLERTRIWQRLECCENGSNRGLAWTHLGFYDAPAGRRT